jgi:hypothetical protein
MNWLVEGKGWTHYICCIGTDWSFTSKTKICFWSQCDWQCKNYQYNKYCVHTFQCQLLSNNKLKDSAWTVPLECVIVERFLELGPTAWIIWLAERDALSRLRLRHAASKYRFSTLSMEFGSTAWIVCLAERDARFHHVQVIQRTAKVRKLCIRNCEHLSRPNTRIKLLTMFISSSPCGIWCIFPLSLIIPSETQYWHLWNFLYKQIIWTDV